MPQFDMPLEKLREYRPQRDEPADFDGFWQQTLAEAREHPLAPRFEDHPTPLTRVSVQDVTFNGFGGDPIKGWFIAPADAAGPLPTVVRYRGYSGGRVLPHEHLLLACAGYAELVMDTRGQGGDTADPAGAQPHMPGFMTLGIEDPATYYYRRVYTDAVRAVEAARAHPLVDPGRVVVAGNSQGGGIALAAGALVPDVAGVIADVAFLLHFRRSVRLTEQAPYGEIVRYLSRYRDRVERVHRTLAYFDGVNMAARVHAPALMSAGLMDDVCPSSGIFAAYNHLPGEKSIKVYEFNKHDGGGPHQQLEHLAFLERLFASGES